MKYFLSALAIMMLASMTGFSEVQQKTTTIGGTTVRYELVLPKNYDTARAYPGVLVFGGGGQTMDTIDSMIRRQFQQEAEKRGYIVVSPEAPDGQLFFMGGEKIFPDFLTKILTDYKIQDNKFHMAGRSNGGISAFHVAALYPQYFISLTGFPGFLPVETALRYKAFSPMCIYMHVGELDWDWRTEMTDQAELFREEGLKVQFVIEKGQEHSIETLADAGSARLFDHFDEARRGCGKAN